MKKVLIYVEGQTEERFVKNLLQGHLEARGVCPIPVLARTKVVKSGGHFKGGVPPFEKVRRELLRLLGDTSAAAVTTMLDYYGLPKDFPGRAQPEGSTCYEQVEFVERKLEENIGHSKFIANLTLHEYEGLLFSSPSDIARTLMGKSDLQERLDRVRNSFRTPEEINDNPQTAPHRRIEEICPAYDKPFHGPLIAERIGLERVRKECPHFDQWLKEMEQA